MVKEDGQEPIEVLEAYEIVTAGTASERMALTAEQRRKSRLRAVTATGTPVGVFLPRGTVLLDGSLLRASDGRIIEIDRRARGCLHHRQR